MSDRQTTRMKTMASCLYPDSTLKSNIEELRWQYKAATEAPGADLEQLDLLYTVFIKQLVKAARNRQIQKVAEPAEGTPEYALARDAAERASRIKIALQRSQKSQSDKLARQEIQAAEQAAFVAMTPQEQSLHNKMINKSPAEKEAARQKMIQKSLKSVAAASRRETTSSDDFEQYLCVMRIAREIEADGGLRTYATNDNYCLVKNGRVYSKPSQTNDIKNRCREIKAHKLIDLPNAELLAAADRWTGGDKEETVRLLNMVRQFKFDADAAADASSRISSSSSSNSNSSSRISSSSSSAMSDFSGTKLNNKRERKMDVELDEDAQLEAMEAEQAKQLRDAIRAQAALDADVARKEKEKTMRMLAAVSKTADSSSDSSSDSNADSSSSSDSDSDMVTAAASTRPGRNQTAGNRQSAAAAAATGRIRDQRTIPARSNVASRSSSRPGRSSSIGKTLRAPSKKATKKR